MRFAAILFLSAPVFGASCDSLSALKLPDTTITIAQSVAAGGFTPSVGNPAPFRNLPAFCRVAATLHPTKDSNIQVEVWMPEAGWNGKFLGVGNGGWSGAVSYGALATGLRRGYATASTDTGHQGPGDDASFALGHPEKLVDFGWRAVHEMTVQAKAVVQAYYAESPKYSYWNGCSSGGKQGLKEAQKFPRDYDGIIAGAPANYWTHLMAGDLWPAVAALKDPVNHIPAEKLAVIKKAVMEACDARDGVRDGLLEDPRQCRFDPKSLVCKEGDGPDCLTAAQVETARKIYAGASNPRTGEQIYPGMDPGSEQMWRALAGGPKPFWIPVSHFQYVVFQDPNWDWRTFDFDRDVARADKVDNGLLNATDPKLTDFVTRGGKLILYHGWNDQLIAARNSIDYYNSVVRATGAQEVSGSVRLFMAPGMNHCSGGDGPSRADWLTTLEDWVEKGRTPERVVAEHLAADTVDRTRPLCAFPKVARYRGTGSIDEAANFDCVTP